ncbi:MAG: bifunctional hydroxymethylpyrimidine kinase/phosphomethylpyrimidine kinase [Parvibaculales bacterium]
MQAAKRGQGSIFVMSSHVVSGQVGLKATMPALRALGHETVTLPTTLLSAHPAAFPAQGTPAGGPIEPSRMLDIADWLLAAGALDDCAAILTGYLPTPAHIDAAAQIIAKIKAVNPQVFYCCDPICGDDGRLYLPEEVMHGLRDRLLPLAQMATPNLYELQMLAGRDGFADEVEAVDAARDLGVAHMVITSAPAPAERIAALAVTAHEVLRCETARAPKAPYGMGDFFAALYLGLHLAEEPKALGIACATLAQMAAANMETSTLPHGPVHIAAAAIQDKLNI